MNFVFINLSQKRGREDADVEDDGAGGISSNSSSKKAAASGEGNRPIAAPAIQDNSSAKIALLIKACQGGRIDQARQLLLSGADVNSQDEVSEIVTEW